MNNRLDLVGKTISGVIGIRDESDGPAKIWMLQFSDGTHVEFVSPEGQRRLRRASGQRRRSVRRPVSDPQLALNVA